MGNSGSRSSLPQIAPVVFVVDDDISLREALESLIVFEGFTVETFSSAEAFLVRAPADGPCCLVLDLTLPALSGLDLQQYVAADRPEMPIIFISGHGDVPITVQAMKAGAVEFLVKPFSNEMLMAAIRGALEKSGSVFSEAAASQGLRDDYALLSTREKQVMALVVTGLLNKQVGGQLGISEITVKTHRGQVMRKMHAASLADLVHMADRLGLSAH
jgi:FixJ family two-component response regulator